MRVLVNTISTKKRAGGAFQIAYNFLQNTLEHLEVDWCYVTSTDLDDVLSDRIRHQDHYYVFPTQPDFTNSYLRVKKKLHDLEQRLKPDVVYSITAPSYFSFEAPEVMRFTNPLVAHPNKYSWRVQTWKSKLRLKAYCWNQKRMMRKARFFITQTQTTKDGIIRITGLPECNVRVVKNVLPSVFSTTDSSHIDTNDDRIHIACIAAPVPHKNLDIIPDVLRSLHMKGINNVCFHLTIPNGNAMINRIDKKLQEYQIDKKCVENHGFMPQEALPEIYRRCTMCFLPTLLEVFSVSTLEALFFDLKIVATDFSFNREVLEDAALYYEPMNPDMAADQLAILIADKSLQDALSARMKIQLAKFDNYEKHFNDIEEFLFMVAQKRIV